MFSIRNLLPVALLAGSALAQTSTSCNPRNQTDCPTEYALSTTYPLTFNSSLQSLDTNFWNVTGPELLSFTDTGMELSLKQKGQSITAISQFYIMWGTVEVLFQAAAGKGIISTLVLLSADLDEIDVEIVGSNSSFVQTNIYGQGDKTNASSYPLDDVTGKIHNYTVDWNKDRIIWYMDGNPLRTQPYASAGTYPQTPMHVQFGMWSGGDSDRPGTVAWAGGKTDWSKGPYTMKVQSMKVTDGSTNTTTYSYGDATGSYESIKSESGESKFVKLLNKKSKVQAGVDKFNGLSTGAKIGIACGVAGALLVALIAFTVFCVKQRRAGKREKALADQSWNEQAAELMTYRQKMARGDFAIQHMGHGEKF